MKLWVVAKLTSQDGSAWELQGVFSTYQAAVAACVEPTDQVWSTELDVVLPRATIEPADAVAPLARQPGSSAP